MTRAEALAVLQTAAGGLCPDAGGCGRLLERIAVQAEAELLRDVLVELGAAALLDEISRHPAGEQFGKAAAEPSEPRLLPDAGGCGDVGTADGGLPDSAFRFGG
jgi:hypothetical protein